MNINAASVSPSAEEATAVHDPLGAPLVLQVAPESLEEYMLPGSAAATSRVPSADDATAFQLLTGELLVVQVAPRFVEV